mmetsp:Transcript_7902/g.11447  ORF Transcript_7902/g.11447 Transcript_7902/m.11447 type:complete len:477 (-) Transcript_7902:16-1446(-)
MASMSPESSKQVSRNGTIANADSTRNTQVLNREDSLLNPLDIDEDAEENEDIAILNMSIIKSILGQSSTNLDDKEGGDTAIVLGKETMRKVSFTGVSSLGSSDSGEKTHDQLIEKIGKIKSDFQQAKCDLSAEKAIRRKKEKNLVKLAKELTKRSKKDNEKDQSIEEMKAKITCLQDKLDAARTEIDNCIIEGEKKTRDYNSILDEAHEKHRRTVAEYDAELLVMSKKHASEIEMLNQSSRDIAIEAERRLFEMKQTRDQYEGKLSECKRALESTTTLQAEAEKKHRDSVLFNETRIAEINQKHSSQTDDLREELLTKSLQCDKIHAEFASLQIKEAPHDADNIANRTMRMASIRATDDTNAPKAASKPMVLMQLFCFISIVLAIFAYAFGLQSMNSICSPVKPGSTLSPGYAYEAPWWAPKKHKRILFTFCGDRPRTLLTWDGKMISITDDDASEVLLNQRANEITIEADSLNFF